MSIGTVSKIVRLFVYNKSRCANPSVHLSVTLRYCVKTKERRGMRSLPPGSLVSLVFWRHEWLMADDLVSECKTSRPSAKTAEMYTSPHNSATVIDSEISSVNANRNSAMGFPTSHQPRSCVTPNFSEMGFRYPNLTFFRINFDKKL